MSRSETFVPRHTGILSILFVLLGCALLCGAAVAEDAPEDGYLGSFARDFDSSNQKLIDLAKAIPADKYGWSPAEGVRSVSETLIHVAGANYFLSQALGVPVPEDFGRDAEATITARDEVIATLESSIEHVHEALAAKAGSDLEAKVEVFGGERPVRDVFMIISGHSHEHLGQLIAYARSIGVTPPWSRSDDG